MGGSSSKIQLAQSCKYNKSDFAVQIKIIQDSYDVAHFYASELLNPVISSKLIKYQNYNELSENYFITKRKEVIPELNSLNPKINNYYDFYLALGTLDLEYEKIGLSDSDRKKKLESIFTIANMITKLLVNDLNMSCESQ
jgi:hypothetical protein